MLTDLRTDRRVQSTGAIVPRDLPHVVASPRKPRRNAHRDQPHEQDRERNHSRRTAQTWRAARTSVDRRVIAGIVNARIIRAFIRVVAVRVDVTAPVDRSQVAAAPFNYNRIRKK